MSVPKLKPGDSKSRPTWFQDVKSGCEKQTDYFLRIRKLQKELINREQHNLVNAMERLKQLQYPRRKPFVRNFDVPFASSKCFPTRPLNTRRDPKHRFNQKVDFEEIKPLKGKVLLPNKTRFDEEVNVESFTLDEIKKIYSMLPILNERQIAKIVHDVRTTFPNEPSTYLLQPHLPSIPNVPRKANKRLDNRLRLLTLTEDSCYIGSTSSIPQIHPSSGHSQRERKADLALKVAKEKHKEKKNKRKRGKKSILAFDVDPNDSSVFANCLETTEKDDMNEDTSPLPPPNSRPASCQKTVVNASNDEARGNQNSSGDEQRERQNASDDEWRESQNASDDEPRGSQNALHDKLRENQNASDDEPRESQNALDEKPRENQNASDDKPTEKQNASDDEPEESVKNEQYDLKNDENAAKHSESEKAVIEKDEMQSSAVELSGADTVKEEETENVSKNDLDKNENSDEIPNVKDEREGQSQLESQSEEIPAENIENGESIHNEAEDTSIIYAEPIVKITKKQPDTLEE